MQFIANLVKKSNTISNATANWELVYETGLFRRTFSDKWYTVKVWHDWDNSRLVKTLDGNVVATMTIPRNWRDRERGDGRKWIVATVAPTMGLHLTPQVEVEFLDKLGGKTLTKRF